MTQLATGAAYLTRTGALAAADPGFAAALGLEGDPSAALRARAAEEPGLRALLAGEGPDVASLAGAGGAPVELCRYPGADGILLVVRPWRADELLEHAMRSQGLNRLAGGLAHDIKNPLNAMALQLALLADKLSGAEGTAPAAGHLGALRDQIGRVNEVLRRFVDVTDPSAPLGYTDVGAILQDTAHLYSHEARRRQIVLEVEAGRGLVRSRCEPGRVGRLVLALVSRALSETPDGGRVAVRAESDHGVALVRIEHGAGDPDPETGYYSSVAAGAARALGGGLAVTRADGVERVVLTLPRNEVT